MLTRALGVAAILMSGSPASAAPAPRQPTAKWVVDFDAAQCVASRNYGTVDKPLVLALKAPPLGNVIQLLIIHPGSAPPYARQLEGTIEMDGAQPIRLSMLAHRAKSRRVVRTNVPLDRFAALRRATSLSVKVPGLLNERFAIPSMHALMRTMDECVADLRKVWNVHEGEGPHARVARGAMANLTGLFKSDDYPSAAITELKSGTVQMAVLVDEAGKVADCTVVATSGVAVLDAQSCAVVQERARFQPALGFDGKPIKSAGGQRITWRLE